LAAEPNTDVGLRDGDVLAIRQLTGWNDVGASISLKSEVLHPGVYGIKEGERLISIIARAGGLRGDAYPYGAIFERIQVREMEQRNRAELVRTVQDEGTAMKLAPGGHQNDKLAKEASLLQWKTTMVRLQTTPTVGRLAIHISSELMRPSQNGASLSFPCQHSRSTYQLAAKHLHEAPQNLVVIEDALAGVQAATTAGIRCIGLRIRSPG